MELGKKKTIMIAIVVVCLVLAAVIAISTRSEDTGIKYLEGKQQWLKCTNPDCGAEYSMPAKEYHKWRQENYNPGTLQVPGMECEECGEESVFAAAKCDKCGHVFFKSGAGRDYNDRCPECGTSR